MEEAVTQVGDTSTTSITNSQLLSLHVDPVAADEQPARSPPRRLRQGDVIPGPAIVCEMDSTTLIESGCVATVDHVGNILINLA